MYKIFKHNGKLIGGHDSLIEEGMEVLFEIDSNNWEEIEAKIPKELLEELNKPNLKIAMGKDLLEFIDNYSSTLTDDDVFKLEQKLLLFKGILNRPRHNPLKLKSFEENLNKLLSTLIKKEQKVIMDVVTAWKQTVYFEE